MLDFAPLARHDKGLYDFPPFFIGYPDDSDFGDCLMLAEYGFDLGPVSFAIPVAAGFFLDDGFHGFDALGNVTDSGYGFVNIGLNATCPLPIDDKFGEWDIHGGITYWNTEDDVINNQSDSFLTWNIGIACAF